MLQRKSQCPRVRKFPEWIYWFHFLSFGSYSLDSLSQVLFVGELTTPCRHSVDYATLVSLSHFACLPGRFARSSSSSFVITVVKTEISNHSRGSCRRNYFPASLVSRFLKNFMLMRHPIETRVLTARITMLLYHYHFTFGVN